jgi:hypothetical protein
MRSCGIPRTAYSSSIDKLKKIVEVGKGYSIKVMKKKAKDPSSNVFERMKIEQKYRELHKSGKAYSIYIPKGKIQEFKKVLDERNKEEKNGGFIPFPLILGVIGGIATAATAVSTVAKTIIDLKNKDKELEEQRRQNKELEEVQ